MKKNKIIEAITRSTGDKLNKFAKVFLGESLTKRELAQNEDQIREGVIGVVTEMSQTNINSVVGADKRVKQINENVTEIEDEPISRPKIETTHQLKVNRIPKQKMTESFEDDLIGDDILDTESGSEQAWNDGYLALKNGVEIGDNPYVLTGDTNMAAAWRGGYETAKTEEWSDAEVMQSELMESDLGIVSQTKQRLGDCRQIFDKFCARKPINLDEKKVDFNRLPENWKQALRHMPVQTIHSINSNAVTVADTDGYEYVLKYLDNRYFYTNTEGFGYPRYVFEIVNFEPLDQASEQEQMLKMLNVESFNVNRIVKNLFETHELGNNISDNAGTPLHEKYGSFQQFFDADLQQGISQRLGYGDAHDAWNANPMLNEMSVIQADTKYEEYVNQCKQSGKKCSSFGDWLKNKNSSIESFGEELSDTYEKDDRMFESLVNEAKIKFEMTGSPIDNGYDTKSEFMDLLDKSKVEHTNIRNADVLVMGDWSPNNIKQHRGESGKFTGKMSNKADYAQKHGIKMMTYKNFAKKYGKKNINESKQDKILNRIIKEESVRLLQEVNGSRLLINEGLGSFLKNAFAKVKNLVTGKFKSKYNWNDTFYLFSCIANGLADKNTLPQVPEPAAAAAVPVTEGKTKRRVFDSLINEAIGAVGTLGRIFKQIKYEVRANPGRAFLLVGPPGVGKSESVYDFADAVGIARTNVKIINLSQKSRAQFVVPNIFPGTGLPFEEQILRYSDLLRSNGVTDADIKNAVAKAKSQKFVPEWAASVMQSELLSIVTASSGGILLLDEIGSADPELVKFFFDVFLQHKIGDFKIPDSWIIMAATNEGGESDGNTLVNSEVLHNSALVDRFRIFIVEPSYEEWIEWLKKNGYNDDSNRKKPGYVLVSTFLNDNLGTITNFFNTKNFEAVRGSYQDQETQKTRSSRAWTELMNFFSSNVLSDIISDETGDKVAAEEIQRDPETFFAKYNNVLDTYLNFEVRAIHDVVLANEMSRWFKTRFKEASYMKPADILLNFDKEEVKKKLLDAMNGKSKITLEELLRDIPSSITPKMSTDKVYSNFINFLIFILTKIEPSPADHVKHLFIGLTKQGDEANKWYNALISKVFSSKNIDKNVSVELIKQFKDPKVAEMPRFVELLQKIAGSK